MPKSKRSRKTFMRLLVICSASVLLLFISALYCGSTMAQDLERAELQGLWLGEWRPYEKQYQQIPGRIPIRLTISEKSIISGSFGDSNFISEKIERQAKQIMVWAKLDRPIRFGKDHVKDHLIILITSIRQDQLSADAHLKSRFSFDFSMHPGELKASKLK